MIRNIIIKFPIIVLIFCLTTILNVSAKEQRIELLESYEFGNIGNIGNLSSNYFILAEKMYGVILNQTETNFIASKLSSENYCRKNMGNSKAYIYLYPISKHAAYFSCVTSLQNKLDQYDLLTKEKRCIDYLIHDMKIWYDENCSFMNDKLIAIYDSVSKEINNEKKYQEQDFITTIISKIYPILQEYDVNFHTEISLQEIDKILQNEINELSNPLSTELNQLKLQNEINELSSPLATELNQLEVNKELQSKINELSSPLATELNQLIINRNIDVCKKYQFEEGSELFFQCILSLIISNYYETK